MIENDFLRKFEASEKIKSLMQYPLNFFLFFYFFIRLIKMTLISNIHP